MAKGNYLQTVRKGRSVFLLPPDIPGNVFYVDNTNGSNSNNGRDWQRAFSTLNYAISKCTDAIGDLILIAPYHAETIEDAGSASGTTTDELVVDKTHIIIRGLGSGMLRPTFTLEGATDAAMVVTAATTHVVIDNLRFVSNLENVGDAITFTATSDHGTVMNCDFQDGAVDEELVTAIAIAADCDDMVILNNTIRTTTGGGCAAGIELAGGSDRIQIIGNIITGDFSAAPIDADQAASTEMVITHNIVSNIDDLGIGLHANCTGIIAWNAVAGGSGTVATGFTNMGKMWPFENYVTDAVAASGIVEPGADSDA